MSARRLWDTWKKDSLLQGIMRNSAYLFSSNGISALLSSLQGILAAALLGPASYGTLGMITMFTTNIYRLLSFRMGELVIKYAGQELALGRKDRAAAIIKIAGIVEGLTSLLAYVLLLALAPIAARVIIKDTSITPLFAVYGLYLVASIIGETSTAVLQLAGSFRGMALSTLAQSILTAVIILVAFFMHGQLIHVLFAYLIGKMIYTFCITGLALRKIRPMLGNNWWKAPLSLLPEGKELIRFAVSTNLSGTVSMLIRDSEVLWVGYFFTSVEAGYFKFALAVMNIIILPLQPFLNTTYPEISKAIARKAWTTLVRLLRRTSLIAAGWTGACAAGALLLGPFMLGWFKKGAYLPALPVILILLIGYGMANILYWNRALLLAFGKPNTPLIITAGVGLLKTILLLWLVPMGGILVQAWLVTGYFIITGLWTAANGLQRIRLDRHTAPQPLQDAPQPLQDASQDPPA